MTTSSNPFVAVFQRVKDYVDGKSVVDVSAPESPVVGDLWFDTDANIGKVWDGSAWVNFNQDDVTVYNHTFDVASSNLVSLNDNTIGDKFKIIYQFDSDVEFTKFYVDPIDLSGITLGGFSFNHDDNTITLYGTVSEFETTFVRNEFQFGFPLEGESFHTARTFHFVVFSVA